MTAGPPRVYEIEPAPDPEARAAIEAAVERVLAETVDAAATPWARTARQEVVDDGLA